MYFKPFRVGKYEFFELIASGGMAEVFHVRLAGAAGFEKEFAVKRILPSLCNDEEFIRSFEDEGKLNSILTHRNIAQVFEFINAGGSYLLVMEYVKGVNVGKLLNKVPNKKLPPEIAIYIINETLKGLDYAHKKVDPHTNEPLNIIHRDISPQNIMVSLDGNVKIIDFGIAKASQRMRQTRTGTLKGKIIYMSPEQALGKSIDHTTDIYATGIVLIELLTGKNIFEEENDLLCLMNVQEGNIPDLEKLDTVIDNQLAQIIYRALAKNIHERYQSCEMFHRELYKYFYSKWPTFGEIDLAKFVTSYISEEDLFIKDKQIASFSTGIESIYDMEEDNNQRKTYVTPTLGSESKKKIYQLGLVILSMLLGVGGYYFFKYIYRVDKTNSSFERLCALSIISEPSGANVELNERIVGITPAELSRPCKSTLKLKLIKAGYKTHEANIELTNQLTELTTKLEKLAPGFLMATVNEEADIYINSSFYNMIKQSEELKIPLDSYIKNNVKFINKKNKTVIERQYELKENELLHDKIIFVALEKSLPPSSENKIREQRSPHSKTAEKSASKSNFYPSEYESLAREIGSSEGRHVIESRYNKGIDIFNNGKYEEALSVFRAVRLVDSNHVSSWLYEIKCLKKMKRFNEAKKTALELLKLKPELKILPVLKEYVTN